DGHAPGLRGSDLSKYIQAGITTDHETVTFEEGFEKLSKGMKVIIREGSAAKNFDALVDLIPDHYSSMMFCSDDKHPDDLLLGHINQLCARAMERGHDLFHVLQMACINPVTHYDLDVGQLQPGDKADLIVVKDLKSFAVSKTIIDGKIVYEEGQLKFDGVDFEILNNFDSKLKKVEDFECIQETDEIRVIEAIDGELITREFKTRPKYEAANIISDLEKDVLKLAVVNRYGNKKPAIGFIKNFGLTKGAIASSVGHDSHNIIAVGVTDDDLCWAVNSLIAHKGGICAVTEDEVKILPLPVAGIMSDQDAQTVGQQYAEIDQMAKAMGSELQAPFMTLSFMALLVIPSLKLSDQGLFDGNTFRFTPLAVD
ncbi:MAG: amidohydrolase family protein, partial [Bacteroidia bacterium]|nr:amidohydrolase family protein [Bacteroidia bacterium]